MIPLLTHNCVDIFFLLATQVTDSLQTEYQTWLSKDELDRLHRLRFQSNQKEFILGKALTRYVFSCYSGNRPSEIVFKHNSNGKPFTDPKLGIDFNISHSKKYIVLAVCGCGEVGIDVESQNRTKSEIILAKKYFAASEYEYLLGLSSSNQSQGFLSLWTLKESYIKAVGQGLSLPLSDFAFEINGSNLVVNSHTKSLEGNLNWSHQLAKLTDHCLCAWSLASLINRPIISRYFNLLPGRICIPLHAQVLARSNNVN